jgi:hypothetical protein
MLSMINLYTNLDEIFLMQYQDLNEEELLDINGGAIYKGSPMYNFLWALSTAAEAIGNPFS